MPGNLGNSVESDELETVQVGEKTGKSARGILSCPDHFQYCLL